ncbi:hypothetical protein ACWKSP_22250 [Micromonosporaceae bacterium Da 78-11]
MSAYGEEHTERLWFVKGTARGDIRKVADEDEARRMVSWNPDARAVILYRDVTYGPMVEADR